MSTRRPPLLTSGAPLHVMSLVVNDALSGVVVEMLRPAACSSPQHQGVDPRVWEENNKSRL
jgi:hypothetical protein